MRNVLKMVYGDQKEVKLESQVFEFGVVEALEAFKTGAKAKVNSAADEIVSGLKELDRVLVKMKNAEKDLGISLSKEINSIKKTDSKARVALKKAESLISDLASI